MKTLYPFQIVDNTLPPLREGYYWKPVYNQGRLIYYIETAIKPKKDCGCG
jgi:hypothetical protein